MNQRNLAPGRFASGSVLPAALLGTAILCLTGCGDFKSMMGLDRHVPDETQVVARPALTLPPDYNLRPPGTTSPVSGVHETGTQMGQAGTQGEQALEANAAADGTPPKKEERGFFGRTFGWIGDMFGDDESAQPAAASQPASGAQQAPSDATPSQSVNGMPGANGK